MGLHHRLLVNQPLVVVVGAYTMLLLLVVLEVQVAAHRMDRPRVGLPLLVKATSVATRGRVAVPMAVAEARARLAPL
jgi:hypothetical protein